MSLKFTSALANTFFLGASAQRLHHSVFCCMCANPDILFGDEKMHVRPPSEESSPGTELLPPLLVVVGKSSLEIDAILSLKTNTALKVAEEKPSIFLQSDTLPSSDILTFQTELYFSTLSARHFGRVLLWSPRLASTQDFIAQNFSELPLGAVCVADVQFKGRGRSKNAWESPPGSLLFSFNLQMENGHILPLLQYVVTLAVTEAIHFLCNFKGLPHLDVRIKWPNDLYLNSFKVGGILCTSAYRSNKFNVTVGVGLNVDNEKPTISLNKVLATSLRREEILAAFFNEFQHLFDVFISEGFQALEDLYYKSWLHGGQRVLVEERSAEQSVEMTAVVIQGLTPSGYLLAVGDDGRFYELHPNGNSFDFFKGLVRKRMEQN